MKLQLRKAFVCLLVLGSALLLMGASTDGEPQAPPSPESFPSKVVWTPDGKHIIFSRGYQGIFMIDVAGSELQAIPADAQMGTPSFPGNALPTLSPDGTQLAYVASQGGSSQSAAIMISALDGAGARRLTHDDRFNTHPEWSPDGEEIAFIADGRLAVMRADGTNARVLAPSLETINAAPEWSPDGSRIAFVGVQQDSPHRAVYTVRRNGTDLTMLGPTVSVPAWSPDGRRIALLKPEDGGEVGLYTLGSVGEDPLKVLSLGESDIWVDTLTWSTNGSIILFASANAEIVVVSLEDIDERVMFRTLGRWAEWSPDGERVAVLASSYRGRGIQGVGQEVLYTKMWDGRFKRTLVEGNEQRMVAKHFGWYDVSSSIAACGQGWVVSDPAAQGFVVTRPYEHLGLVEDCALLIRMRDRLAGDFLLNWSPETPITEWWGVFVHRPDARVGIDRVLGLWIPLAYFSSKKPIVSLVIGGAIGHPFDTYPSPQGRDIKNRGLNGSIPPELGGVSELTFLNLSDHSLTGSIPSELGELKQLLHLDLSNNKLTGEIPPELANTRLWDLDLSGNDLSGEIPPDLGAINGFKINPNTIVGLTKLILANNRLSGSIPVELRNQDDLRVLDLSNNNLSGSIPHWLGGFFSLWELNLSHNELSGSILPEFANLGNLSQLDLSHNDLTGSIPPELGLGRLNDLSQLDLSHNRLSGHIPPELGLGNLRHLEVLNLAHNDLNGDIPLELANLSRLKELYLQGNEFTGCVPAALSREDLTVISDGLEFCAE